MNHVIAEVMERNNADYERLPPVIAHMYTERQWSFLSDREKATLVQRETEPEI